MIQIITDIDGGKFYLQFGYSYALIQVVKTMDGRKWNPELKLWSLPATPAQASTIDRVLSPYRYTGDDAFQNMLAQHEQGVGVMEAEPTPRETDTPCFRHQLVGLDLTIQRKAIILAWDMGVGKSKTVVDTAGLLGLNHVLILCPKSVVGEWPRQFTTHGRTYGIRCISLRKHTVSKRTKVATKALTMGPTALVINYEAARCHPFADWALAQNWDLIVCDESHRIKGDKSKISKFCHKLADRGERRICLTGTPITNSPLDLWSQCRFLDEGLFGSSFAAFRNRFSIMGGFQNKQVLAFRKLEEMNKRFYEIAHRVTKEECLDLPEQMDVEREVELGPKGRKHYEEMEGQFVAQLEDGTITLANVLVESLRLQQCTGGAVKYDEANEVIEIDTAKAEALEDILMDLPIKEPMVVFCRFHHDLDAVHSASTKAGRKSLELSGRRNELDAWREANTDATVIAVQIQAGGLGIDLTRSRYALYFSLGFSLGEYLQSRSRLHRIGQEHPVTYYHLIARSGTRQTIDHKIYKAILKKGNIAEEVLSMAENA